MSDNGDYVKSSRSTEACPANPIRKPRRRRSAGLLPVFNNSQFPFRAGKLSCSQLGRIDTGLRPDA
jgi:hypothetical protein